MLESARKNLVLGILRLKRSLKHRTARFWLDLLVRYCVSVYASAATIDDLSTKPLGD